MIFRVLWKICLTGCFAGLLTDLASSQVTPSFDGQPSCPSFLSTQSQFSSLGIFLNTLKSTDATVKLGMACFPDAIRPVGWETQK